MAMKAWDHSTFFKTTPTHTSLHAGTSLRKVKLFCNSTDVQSEEGFEGEWNSYNIVDVEVKGETATYSI